MKKTWMAICAAAFFTLGGSALAEQPGLSSSADGIRTEEASRAIINAKYPVLTEGAVLRRAWINAAIEVEVAGFYENLEKQNQIAPVNGWVTYLVGRQDETYVSLVLLESVMHKGAAHPSTVVKGMTFDKAGNQISRKQILTMLPMKAGENIDRQVKEQAASRGISLFSDADAKVWPKEFFIGTDGHVHFIFQQYDIAPYAAGWIAIDAGALPAVDPASHP